MRGTSLSVLAIALILGFANPTITLANLVSTFDNNTENWTTVNNSGVNPVHQPLEGGFIQATDSQHAIVAYFVSPDSWDGNWTPYIGGTLSYQIKIIDDKGGPPLSGYDSVRIYSGANYLSWISSTFPNKTSWTEYSVELIASNFTAHGASFADIMNSVTALWIQGEYIGIIGDITGLDNVNVVPLPGAMLLLGSGLLGLGALGWRRRRPS